MTLLYKLVDSNLNYNDIDKIKFDKLTEINEINSWKNDTNIAHLLVYTDDEASIKIDVEKMANLDATVYAVKESKVYGGNPVPPIPLYTDEDRVLSSDILIKSENLFLKAKHFQSFFIEFNVGKDIEAKSYKIEIIIEDINSSKEHTKELLLNVDEKIVNMSEKFDIELWQYPYRVAEYYNIEDFSDKHFDILKRHLQAYKEVGGEFITATLCEDPWGGQTYAETDVKYPSMIKWTKVSNGFEFDYTDFDKWIEFCISENLARKIMIYGMAPWHQSFTYYEDGKLVYEKFDFSSEKYLEYWQIFLKDFISHLEDKNIFDRIYLGIDEQGFCEEVFDVVESIKNSKGESLRIAAAIDNYTENAKYADKVEHVSVSMIEFEKDRERFYKFMESRRAHNQCTLLYSCVGHKPGNFSLSQPGETYFTLVSASLADGFLRWAYDAWVKEPLLDASHKSFEPGDCFLVYPSESNEYIPNISIRMLKIKEALFDIYKLREIASSNDESVKSVLNNCKTKFIHSTEYFNESKIDELIEDINKIKQIF